MSKIILLGYMGSGKSTVAESLALKTGLPHIDLDHEIEMHAGDSVSNIFAVKGEIWFRKTEHQILKEVLQRPENYILSLGGGTPCYANNHKLLFQQKYKTVYLKASIPTLCERLKHSLETRPLLHAESEESLSEYIAKHLFERRYFYEMSTITISTDHKNPDSIANEILNEL
jgi:shikimate kinase